MINNKLRLELLVIKENEIYELDGLKFSNSIFLRPIIDEQDILNYEEFLGSVIVLNQLVQSTNNSGKYLIFTCACGIADDSGWELVNVTKTEDSLFWKFTRNNRQYSYKFELSEYIDQIKLIQKKNRKL
ncbi:hypothetical protein ND861_19365 [Leptospira sp. 2 VSF19]|uniref:Phage protein n=1 Tax=Leptospira soteropolitanensis TaxID=2950025 RepID=A0AAW5VK49_9LEPT|nr:hypothetical protein [Leptospira soteropolitanensis]MCW7494829.1 hypothetical protein [Leptospira soteropolitanensis]MCW7502427.1 hypothetical protein [Leptospira soteropolitanensis]MCW7524509.1 hypothetical protein [Leptospira soteropolitanensis]MCW7528524.1 hypothetical protein [Leptospira soteropolitanensis]MCW7532243.1 hypothetical protein [Leptospira soteropolitanensis]